MTEAEQAYAAAERLIAGAKADGARRLSFDRKDCRDLAAIPPQIAELNRQITWLSVTSRKVIWLFPEQLWLQFVPVLHRLQGRLAAQG